MMNEIRTGIFATSAFIGLVIGPLLWVPSVCRGGEIIRRSGQHITLSTDIDSPQQVDDLIQAFDAAVPQWAAFWELPAETLNNWKVDACVIRDKASFLSAGLIPDRVPDFPFGYALNNRVWVMAQQSQYYTRHLLLHEGVHALAFDQFGGAGPSWFMEGTAELLSVHKGHGAETKINEVPVSRESVPFWGRFKLMSQRRASAGVPALDAVMNYPRDMKADVESYGWSWSAAMLLSQYPEYRRVLLKVARNGDNRQQSFNQSIRRELGNDWPVLTARWRLMCHDLDYGFDWSREQASLSMNDKVWDGQPIKLTIAANQGWQSIGVRLNGGTTLKVLPKGRCQLALEPKPWISEPAGITFRYHRGRPLGQLLACLIPNAPADAAKLAPLKLAPITTGSTIAIKEDCWMLFRVNDAADELSDNEGGYEVTIQ